MSSLPVNDNMNQESKVKPNLDGETNLEYFLNWLYCLCVVTFDLEVGQVMEQIYPVNQYLSKKDRSNICYMAFPDSNQNTSSRVNLENNQNNLSATRSNNTNDCKYMFRFRQSSCFYDDLNNPNDYFYNKNIANIYEKDSTHFYGYTYFRQIKDAKVKRGYIQKSVVLVTRLPYPSFFLNLLEVIALDYFDELRSSDNANNVLLQACKEINNWLAPWPGRKYKLPLLGYYLRTRIPVNDEDMNLNSISFSNVLFQELQDEENQTSISKQKNDLQIEKCMSSEPFTVVKVKKSVSEESFTRSQSAKVESNPDDKEENVTNLPAKKDNSIEELDQNFLRSLSTVSIVNSNKNISSTTTNMDNILIPNLSEIGLWSSLGSQTNYLTTLWEIVLLNEPLVLIASSPYESSNTVQALLSLIAPLKYHAEFRPYFTIHDSEYQEFTGKEFMAPSCILGVTNPFFVRQLSEKWPNILKLDGSFIERQAMTGSANTSKNNSPFSSNSSLSKSNGFFDLGSFSLTGSSSNSNKQKSLDKLSSNNIDALPGLYSNYSPKIYPDITKLYEVNSNSGQKARRPYQVKDAVYKRYFKDLTEAFIGPLERYILTLMPLHKDISPFNGVPNLKPFDGNTFLIELKEKMTSNHPSSNISSSFSNFFTKNNENFSGFNLAGETNWSRISQLYCNFMRSPNFHGWLEKRRKEMRHRICKIHFLSILSIETEKNKNCVWNKFSVVKQVDSILKFKKVQKDCNLAMVYFIENKTFDQMSNDGDDKTAEIFLKVFENEKERLDYLSKLTTAIEELICQLPEDTKDLVRSAHV